MITITVIAWIKKAAKLPALSETVIVPETEPAVGAVMETVGAELSTVTETAAEVVVLPAASRATAVRL